MANITYSNPTSYRNDIGFKPEGFLGGGLFQEHENDYRQAQQADMAFKGLGYLEEQNKMRDYALDEPVRSSRRPSDIATNQANAQYVGQIKGGEAADAEVKMKTVKENIGIKMLDLKSKQDENGQKQFDNHMKQWDALGPTLSQLTPDLRGMAQYEEIRKAYPQLGLSPQFNAQENQQKAFVAKAYMDALKNREMEAKREELTSLEKRNKYTADMHLKGQQGNNAATIEAAKQKALIEKPLTMVQQEAQWRKTLSQGPKVPGYEEAQIGLSGIVAGKIKSDPEIASLGSALSYWNMMDTPKAKAKAQEITDKLNARKKALIAEGMGGNAPAEPAAASKAKGSSKDNPVEITSEASAKGLPVGTWIRLNGRIGQIQ